ncbi:biotin/lipoyl-binding protein [Candidatus Chloroploca sp. M-50]|uniref:Biotin/lipoyl-binding protein n=1 Tax=Candidatus Chloroploca mongolica TaxID=2528176 RepID=A0ABS4D4Y1_9CHLR|nr:biotin/lipoyl-binding protein [Candidatus Chloroploca mongolica]MBP1464494.1 biotin/lipoyl-binding protein [Candidatus Chloroploca mongolica]
MRKLVIGLIVVVVLLGGGIVVAQTGLLNPAPATTSTASPVDESIATPPAVIADARVVPVAEAHLAFERSGTVAAVLVAEGDLVTEGQALARLDTRELELRVARARVNLERAQAHYKQVASGAAPEAIAAAEASIAQAAAQRSQVVTSVSPQDLAAAQAQLAEARAALAALLDGPQTSELDQTQAAVDQARTALDQQQTALSAARTNAELALEQTANALRNAQDAYSRIYWENIELADRLDDEDLPQARIDQEAAALRAVENAEHSLAQAQVAVEQAQQNERDGLANAEARLREAEARQALLVAAPTNDRIAAARTRIAQAEANLARLQGAQRTSQIAVAAAGIELAEANRDQVSAAPREVDLVAAQVEINAAQVDLDQALLDLERATLVAPIAGSVAQLNLTIGEVAGPGIPALILADLQAWQIETDDLSELDVVHLREGDAVMLTFDALPDLELPGHIIQIKAIGSSRQGDIVYTVVIEPDRFEPRLRWNMTAVMTAT